MVMLGLEKFNILLSELVAIDTVSPFNEEKWNNVQRFLAPFGFKLENGMFVKGNINSKVWIYTHIDTKPPVPIERWNTDPFQMQEVNDSLFGLGISDAKFQLLNIIRLLENEYFDCYTIIDTAEETSGAACAKMNSFANIDTLVIVDGVTQNNALAYNGLMGQFDGEIKLRTGMQPVHPARRASPGIVALVDELIQKQKHQAFRFHITGVSAPYTVRSLTLEELDIRFDLRFTSESACEAETFLKQFDHTLKQHLPPVRGEEVFSYDNIISEACLPFSCGLGLLKWNIRRVIVIPGAQIENSNHKPNEFIYKWQIEQHYEALRKVMPLLVHTI